MYAVSQVGYRDPVLIHTAGNAYRRPETLRVIYTPVGGTIYRDEDVSLSQGILLMFSLQGNKPIYVTYYLSKIRESAYCYDWDIILTLFQPPGIYADSAGVKVGGLPDFAE